VARSRRRPDTSAPLADRAAAGGGRAERVEALLAGESLDTSRVSYDFDVEHLALIAAGSPAGSIDRLLASTNLPHLVVRGGEGVVWAWIGSPDGFNDSALEALSGGGAAVSPAVGETCLAIGEPARGLGGWRFSHHQARAALAVALRGGDPVVRYADVALLASAVRDDLLATSLRRLYLEPLGDSRDGGEEMRRTLRAYFDAGRNVSEAGSAIGVTRQAVARRIRLAEKKLGRSLDSCGAELETALRFEALGATPLSAP
jgi:PucR C-terminal helix-turn-helix domain/GGDEF-like domain